jgi:uncharacterized protein YbbC (DUF1343 family)
VRVKTSLEKLLEEGLYKDKDIGLITNHTGLNPNLRQNYEVLVERGYRIRALFSPEHGIRGDAAEGARVGNETEPRTGIPVYSLYGESRAPQPETLQDIDVLMFDIQDIGARYYTYPSTMLESMRAAASAGVPFVVLDRPNPIGGTGVEGNVPSPHDLSFVCYAPVAIRHGMTLGEIALLESDRLNLPAPHVIRAEGWKRDMYYDDTGLGPWVPPSPASSTQDMALLYPGTCLLEGTNLSEGRGTSSPFEVVGAPYVDPDALAEYLRKANLPGVLIRPTYFTPWHWKHVGKVCGGVQFHVVDKRAVRPVELGIRLLFAARDLFPAFALREHLPEEAQPHKPPYLDRLGGGPELRTTLMSGKPANDLISKWRKEASEFERGRRAYLLY